MSNIRTLKIDLDEPNTWINAEVTLRNMSEFNNNAKKAGVVPTEEQLLQILQINNDKLPAIPIENYDSVEVLNSTKELNF